MNPEPINMYAVVEFWEYIKPLNKDEYVEIRLTPSFKDWKDKKEYYTNIERFKQQHPQIILKKGCQFFIKKFEELKTIIEFNNNIFFNKWKICYALTNRVKDKEGNIAGGYDNIRYVDKIFFDIDKKTHGDIINYENELIKIFYTNFVEYMGRYGLDSPTIISSGAGYHILYKITPQKLTDGKKRWFKKWVEEIKNKFSNNNLFEVDGIKDFTRVFGFPESMNVKRQRRVKIVELNNKVNNFKLRYLKQPTIKDDYSNIKTPKVLDSLEWKIITQPNLPKGDIHTILLFALKLLMKANGIKDYLSLQNKLNSVRGSNHILNPYYGTEGKSYNMGIIINWCRKHQEWCEENKINYEDYINFKNEEVELNKLK